MTPEALYALVERTWPPATACEVGPWTIRDGQGGGKRACATTARAPFDGDDIAQAEAEMRTLDQPALFMIRKGDDALDAALEARGYRVIDPVVAHEIATATLTQAPVPPVSAFALWPPLAIQRDLWAEGGIGPARVAVMERTNGPKAAILARHRDQPAGAGFVAIHAGTAMIHAIEVTPALRRQGVGANILRCAAHWAQDQGAQRLALLVTEANDGANALYSSQGFTVVGHYHYRIR